LDKLLGNTPFFQDIIYYLIG